MGLKKLLGRGDMLFKPIDENHPIRLQGAFLSDDDVESVVTFIKDQSEAQYDESFDPGEVDESQVGTGASNTALVTTYLKKHEIWLLWLKKLQRLNCNGL